MPRFLYYSALSVCKEFRPVLVSTTAYAGPTLSSNNMRLFSCPYNTLGTGAKFDHFPLVFNRLSLDATSTWLQGCLRRTKAARGAWATREMLAAVTCVSHEEHEDSPDIVKGVHRPNSRGGHVRDFE